MACSGMAQNDENFLKNRSCTTTLGPADAAKRIASKRLNDDVSRMRLTIHESRKTREFTYDVERVAKKAVKGKRKCNVVYVVNAVKPGVA